MPNTANLLMRHSAKEIAAMINGKAEQLRSVATAEERASLNDLVQRSIAATKPLMIPTIVTPTMMAILWLEHNRWNRDWNPKTSAAYAQLMVDGQWRITSQTVYALSKEGGDLLDGGHRGAAQILADCTLDMFICLGMSKDDLAALDCGKKRHAYEVSKLLGIANAKEKQTVLVEGWNYLAHVGIISDAVDETNVNGVAAKIQEHDRLLTRALDVGAAATANAEFPLLKELVASRVAGVLLRCGWNQETVIDMLGEIQTSEFASETTPLLFARDHIEAHAQPETVWSLPKQIAVIIKGMLMATEGVQMTTRNTAKLKQLDGAATRWPDPRVAAPVENDEVPA